MSENRPLERLFNRITLSYDRMNRILTLGLDKRWRRKAASAAARAAREAVAADTGPAMPPTDPAHDAVTRAAELTPAGTPAGPRAHLLDLCTGTGDLAYLLAETLGDEATVIGLDYSPQMLERAEEKRKDNRENPEFVLGDAAALPYDADFFDAVTVSFAFRNLTYRNPRMDATLAEIRRVVKPGGKLIIVESSQPGCRLIRFFRDVYVELMVGKLVAGLADRGAYRYLADSVKRYYNPAEMEQLLSSAGFTTVEYTPLFFGAAGLYVAS